MRNRRMLRRKRIGAILLSVAMIVSLGGCAILEIDNESFKLRDLINRIVDADAMEDDDSERTVMDEEGNVEQERGTIQLKIYAITDEPDADDGISGELYIYGEDGDLVWTSPLEIYEYTNRETEDKSTYSVIVLPGVYTVQVAADRYDVQSQQVTIRADENVNIDFEFVSSGDDVSREDDGYASFADVLESVQTSIGYDDYSDTRKEYCRGEFFEVDGRNALVMMYYADAGAELTTGYYVGLWVENSRGKISCLTNELVVDIDDPEDAFAYVAIREINGKMYLNPYVRTTDGMDISKNPYYCIGDELVLEYDLYSEVPIVSIEEGMIQHDYSASAYYLNQEQVEQSAFYSKQDELNDDNTILVLNPFWTAEGDPEGDTFEELAIIAPDAWGDPNETADSPETEQTESIAENDTDTITEQDLIGEWTLDNEYTMEYTGKSLTYFYGTMLKYGYHMTFGSDGSYEYGVSEYYGKGSFELRDGELYVDLTEGNPFEGKVKLFVMTDDVICIAMDQFGDGNLIFWIKED